MAQTKFTKGELKKQRDALAQYKRYLPTLQLKKQQLQIEIVRQLFALEEKNKILEKRLNAANAWAGLLKEDAIDLKPFLRPQEIQVSSKNVAGVDIPVFEKANFSFVEYDLFLVPLWVDAAIEELQTIVTLREEIAVLIKGASILKQELRVTTQRVNLFEKVKIPGAEETIRLIKIYIGDQMSNAVGRSKMAKRKIEAFELEGAFV